MTPLAASVPYSVAADGPLTISMSSISSGESEFMKLSFVPPTPGLIELEKYRTPSTIMIGALLRLSEFRPRMRITGAEPLMFGGDMITPGAFATRRSAMLETAVCSTFCGALIVDSALPISTFRWSPVAVVTTSCNWTTSGDSVKSSVTDAPGVTVTDFFCS